jgi:8-oxo-dGTP pyrophosphatase MutT (NUDIX family)
MEITDSSMQENPIEVYSFKEPEVEKPKQTVRCMVFNAEGKVLLLKKKGPPGAFEFPGGQIGYLEDEEPNDDKQLENVIREVEEETGLEIEGLKPEKVGRFQYNFGLAHEKKTLSRIVHLWKVQLPEGEFEVVTDKTVSEKGESEDKHLTEVKWVSLEELRQMKEDGKLLGNSEFFEEGFS